ncbi:hypothetical protein SAMN05444421_1051 [Celeribacter marinus]|nr:hypothetical protein SAMN05444421_1051 [Celeribacter marinus]
MNEGASGGRSSLVLPTTALSGSTKASDRLNNDCLTSVLSFEFG